LELSKLPDDTIIEVEAVSLESIHPHDLYAYKRVTLGSVRSLVTSSPHPWEAF
jgi:GTP cyclohydrolase FolE2